MATRAIAGNLPDYVLGPDLTAALEGRHYTPLGLGFDAVTMLPGLKVFGRTADVTEHLVRGLAAGEDVSKVIEGAKTVAQKGLNPADRVLRYGNIAFHNPASRTRVLRYTQRVMDKAAQGAIDTTQLQGRIAAPYVQHFVNTARAYTDLTNRIPGEVLASYHLKPAERMALEVVATETHPADWIKNNESLIKEAEAGVHGSHPSDIPRLQEEIKQIQAAQKLIKHIPVHEATGIFATHLTHGTTPVFSQAASPKLHQALEDLITTGQLAEQRAQDPRLEELLGFKPLTQEAAAERISSPGRFRQGARWIEQHAPATVETKPNSLVRVNGKWTGQIVKINQDGTTADVRILRRGETKHPVTTIPISQIEEKTGGKLVGQESWNGGRAYIPSVPVDKKFFQGKAGFAGDVIPHSVSGLGQFKNPYTTALAKGGLEVHDPTSLVSRHFLQIQKINDTMEHLSGLRAEATPQAGVLENLDKHGIPKMAKAGVRARGWVPVRMTKAAPLSIETRQALAALRDPAQVEDMIGASLMKTLDAQPHEIAFLPKAIVGDLLKSPGSSKDFRWLGDISTFIKNLIVYTKMPGHIPPRLASNASMNLMQQGISMVPNTYATIKLFHEYPQIGRIIDAAMQTRKSFRSFAEEGTHEAMQKFGSVLAAPVVWTADKAPRASALTYEVTQAVGTTLTTDQMAKKIMEFYTADPKSELGREWRMVVQRANRAQGDYVRSGSLEKKIAPYVFLYKWQKVAFNLTAKTALEHPLRAAAVGGAVGRYAFNGSNPPYEQFGVPLSGGRISNITTSFFPSTPITDAEYAYQTGKSLYTGKAPPFANSLPQLLNPLIPLTLGLAFSRDPTTGKAENFVTAMKNLSKQFPPVALAIGKNPTWQRIGKYIFGNEFPQNVTGTGTSNKPLTQKQIDDLFKKAQARLNANGHNSVFNNPKVQAALNSELKKLQATP